MNVLGYKYMDGALGLLSTRAKPKNKEHAQTRNLVVQ